LEDHRGEKHRGRVDLGDRIPTNKREKTSETREKTP